MPFGFSPELAFSFVGIPTEPPTTRSRSKKPMSNESNAGMWPVPAKFLRSMLTDYLPLRGTFRRNSSKKFSRKITWLWACCDSGVSTCTNAAMRLPSGARS